MSKKFFVYFEHHELYVNPDGSLKFAQRLALPFDSKKEAQEASLVAIAKYKLGGNVQIIESNGDDDSQKQLSLF